MGQKARRIFVISDFKDESPRAVRVERRRWPKGFCRLGHDVQRFAYRNILTQFNPFSGKYFRRFMPAFVRRYADDIMAQQVKVYHPDIVFVGSMKYLTHESIFKLREAAPKSVFVGRDNDPYPERNLDRLAIAKTMDIVTTTGADGFLKTYKDAGVPICAFMPNPCDPDIQYDYENLDPRWQSDVIFTGKEEHKRLDRESERFDLLSRLAKMKNSRLYGCFGNPLIDGVETFWAISQAKLALSISYTHTERLYHSDRLVNCISCGAMTLAKRVPDTDLLFEDKKHVRYFESNDEFFELADWYLKHEDERQKIARAGMEFAHREYNCARMAQYTLDLVDKGDYDAPWKTIL